MVMLIFHGSFRHDSRLHDMNRFSKHKWYFVATFDHVPYIFCSDFCLVSILVSINWIRSKGYCHKITSIKSFNEMEQVPLTQISLEQSLWYLNLIFINKVIKCGNTCLIHICAVAISRSVKQLQPILISISRKIFMTQMKLIQSD